MKKEFVQLAKVFDAKKHGIGGWLASEKLDGQRFVWEPLTRGMLKSDVPWANCDKDERLVEEQYSTGLWSRLGNVIHAPDWWLDQMPNLILDGELYNEDWSRQELMKVIKPHVPDQYAWEGVHAYAFDVIPSKMFCLERQWVKVSEEWETRLKDCLEMDRHSGATFRNCEKIIKQYENNVLIAHPQVELSFQQEKAVAEITEYTEEVVIDGGEGMMLRDPNSAYHPSRSHDILKVKPRDDMEGTFVGWISGRETDKGSKLLGKMGAMILRLDSGKRLELSGFTDEERGLFIAEGAWATDNPGIECPWSHGPRYFEVGQRISFKHRGFTDDGIPSEAAYWRKEDNV